MGWVWGGDTSEYSDLDGLGVVGFHERRENMGPAVTVESLLQKKIFKVCPSWSLSLEPLYL